MSGASPRVEHATKTSQEVFNDWPDLDEPEHANVATAVIAAAGIGGTGLLPITELGIHNGILLEFRALPVGIQDLVDSSGNFVVNFDATRQIALASWKRQTPGEEWEVPLGVSPKFFPLEVELPNDDAAVDFDTSTRPDVTGLFYSFDAPGPLSNTAFAHELQWRFGAREWVRVAFGGESPEAQGIAGSRASFIELWHVVHTLTNNGDDEWERTTGDLNEVPLINTVDMGAIEVGAGLDTPP